MKKLFYLFPLLASLAMAQLTAIVDPVVTLFTTQTPAMPFTNDPAAGEYGVRFSSDVAGSITAIKFWKGTGNTGTHTVALWRNSDRVKLAQATATNEPASGWVTVSLATPIAITANTLYTASYHAPRGHYADTYDFFTSTFNHIPLHAPVTAGVYRYSSTVVFPASSYRNSNYWIDVVFSYNTAPPQVHTVGLSWTEVSTSVTFNVLRATTTGGPYTGIALGLSQNTFAYTDRTVMPGATYYYVIVARNTAGVLSPNSNEVTAVIPSP